MGGVAIVGGLLSVAVGLLVFRTDDAPANHRLCPRESADVPPEVAFSATAVFPRDDFTGDTPGYSLRLLRLREAKEGASNGALVGVFERSPQGSRSTDGAVFIPEIGPDGLAGVRSVEERDLLVVARDIPETPLMALAASFREAGLNKSLFDVVAEQDMAMVPGSGSMPIAPSATAYGVSYTSDALTSASVDAGASAPPAQENQISLVVACYAGAASDLDVLSWWIGNERPGIRPNGAERASIYVSAAFASGDGGVVPDALLSAAWFEDGVVVLVRTVGFDRQRHDAIVQATRNVTESRWDELDRPPDEEGGS